MKQIVWKLIITSGIMVALAGCGTAASSGATQSKSAPAAAATMVSSATGDVWATTGEGQPGSAPANNGQAPASQGVMGQVISVNGTTLIVQNQRQQSTITVTLTDSTRIFKQATIDIANVPVGETVSAIGSQDGSTFTATQVRVGAAANVGGPGGAGQPGGNGGAGQQGGGPGGTPPAGGNGAQPQPNGTAQPGGNMGNRLVGTVEQVSGDTLTIKTAAGETIQIRLAENGQITQQVAGTQADITVGAQITVMGDQNDAAMTATQVNVTPATAKQQ